MTSGSFTRRINLIDWIIIDVGEKVVTTRSGFNRVFAWEPMQSRMIITGTVEVNAGGVVLTTRVLEWICVRGSRHDGKRGRESFHETSAYHADAASTLGSTV